MTRKDFMEVSKEEFFSVIGPMDVHPVPYRDKSVWEDKYRNVVGESTPGYMCEGPTAYFLKACGVQS